MIVTVFIISLLYLLLIGAFLWGFHKIRRFRPKAVSPKTTFSIIIPFRNEAGNLPRIVSALRELAYPKHLFEVIFVDDDSTDNSVDRLNELLILRALDTTIIKNNRMTPAPKKDAITTGIAASKYEWVITTDADCVLPRYWLNSYDAFIQHTKSQCIVGPVRYLIDANFFNSFQVLDFLSLQATAIGAFGIRQPFLSNGANLAYTKSLFHQLQGFEGNTHIASGDDIFLLEKAVRTHPGAVHYMKCKAAIVNTFPEPTWRNYLQQRIRWASKAKAYNNWFGKYTGAVVLSMNALIIIGAVLFGIGLLSFEYVLFPLILKLSIDFSLLYVTALFFDQQRHLKQFLISFLMYPFVTVYSALMALFSSYSWKGRTFKS